MRRALKDKLANHKIPQEMKTVDELPKNAMGKSKILQCKEIRLADYDIVNKKSLVKQIFGDDA